MYKCNGGKAGKNDCAIGLMQIHCKMNDIEGNLKEMVKRIQDLAEKKAELMIAPEVALTGWLFKMEDWRAVAQTIPGPATEEIGAAAKKANAYVIFGMVEKLGEALYNSVAVVGPKGSLVARYRKTHLWSFEHDIFKPGEEICLVDMEFGIVGVTICYDACFPEFIRSLAANGANIISHSTFWLANEPFNKYGDKKEIHQSYCRTRAFENQVYFASANRVGNDDFLYGLGNSVVMTPWGDIAGKLFQTPGTLVVKTEWEKLAAWQQMEPLWPDRRPEFYFKIMDFCKDKWES
jgi:predicted amidohydrolase